MKDLNIIHLQRKRNILRKSLKNHPQDEQQLSQLRQVRNQLKFTIRETKKRFLKSLLSNKSSSETWKVINKILHPPMKRIDVDPDDINQFFNTTAIRTTGRNTERLTKSYINEFPDDPNNFRLRSVTYEEVLKSIGALRLDCSTGYDNIPAKFVKPVAEYLVSPLTHIINSCIESSIFPDDWKISRICPVPKTNP